MNDMLRDEIAKYTELTGEDASHTPIMKIGAYLDGYEKGLSVLEEIRAEIEQVKAIMCDEIIKNDRKDLINFVNGLNQSLCIIDKYRQEG